ncbi:MAG: FecR domain-containing protein [Cyclobacteriaceae bacterium]
MEKIVEIVGKQLRGEITTGENEHLAEWLKSDAANQKVYEEIKWVWDNTAQHYKEEEVNIGEAWSAFTKQRDQMAQEKTPLGKRVWIAAAAIVLAMLFGYLYINPIPTTKNEVVYAANNTIQENIQLPDGSLIWLNKNAKVTYGESNGERLVTLAGEAFFEVAHDANKPFVIHTGNMQTQVVGTSFNIRYQAEEPVVVSVASGKVKVYDDNQTILLTKGQESQYDARTGKLEKSVSQDPNFLSWKTGKLVFENSTIQYVTQTLFRHYGQQLAAIQPDVDEVRLTASFEQQSLEQVLELIYLTTDVQLTISNP